MTALALLLTGAAGYRLTAQSAADIRGRVLRTVPYSEGVALLIETAQGDCSVELVRRFGPLWRTEGWSGCGFADESHPFRYAGRGDGWKSGDVFHSVMAVGGIFRDERIARIRMAGQPEQAVSGERGFLFVYEHYSFGGFPPTQALAEDGTILFTLHIGTGWEWVVPPTLPPLPGRMTKQEERTVWDEPRGILAGDPRSSVWQNGEVQINGEWQPFYVWADGREGFCGLGTAVNLTWRPWYQVYPCPEPMGALRITGINATGNLVSFIAPDGRSGRFDLASLTWHMGGE